MNDDELLFAAVIADPVEATPRLALADWFDEHDEPNLASALREEPNVVSFLADLARWDVTPVWRGWGNIPDTRAADTARFSRAACELLTRFRSHFPEPPAGRADEAQPVDANTLLGRWAYERSREIGRLRERAAREAANQPDAVRLTLPSDGSGEAFERTACYLHELVIREQAGNVAFGALERTLRERQHPLAWLPPQLFPVESELRHYLPQFTPGGTGWTLPGNPLSLLGEPPERPAEPPAVVDSETLTESVPAFSAVRGWAEESNGLLEGRVYRLDRPLIAEQVGGSWFACLTAESLTGALTEPQWSVNRRLPAEAFAQLFAAAHTGGAYGRREWGAYGRLRAWQSLAALAGCGAGAGVVAVAAKAERCQWLTFGGTDWFYDLIDLGLICVRPDGRSVALLAATDTD